MPLAKEPASSIAITLEMTFGTREPADRFIDFSFLL
jgi:hypothetical protein